MTLPPPGKLFRQRRTFETGKRVRRYRPGLEPLEDRLAPAFDLGLSFLATVGVTRTLLATTATYEATATGANLSWLDVGTDLSSGLDVVVTSGTGGEEGGNITDLSPNVTIGNAPNTLLTFHSGSGTGLVGDITLTDVRLEGPNSAVVVTAANNLAVGTLDS